MRFKLSLSEWTTRSQPGAATTRRRSHRLALSNRRLACEPLEDRRMLNAALSSLPAYAAKNSLAVPAGLCSASVATEPAAASAALAAANDAHAGQTAGPAVTPKPPYGITLKLGVAKSDAASTRQLRFRCLAVAPTCTSPSRPTPLSVAILSSGKATRPLSLSMDTPWICGSRIGSRWACRGTLARLMPGIR